MIAAFVAGLLYVSGFAPFGWFPVPVLALAALFRLWLDADGPRAAAWLGFAFGLGMFTAGMGWLYIALHDYGGMPVLLALLATLSFAAFYALLPALAGYAQARFPPSNGANAERARRISRLPAFVSLGVLMPSAWVLVEWLRGILFTGLPWLSLGYAHSDSPLAGYAPLFGVYGVSLAAAVSAGLLALAWQARAKRRIALAACAGLWLAGALLRTVAWTQPQGEPFSVALVQGNIAQDLKFKDEALAETLETYRRLATQTGARLTVLPETAFPLLRSNLPDALTAQLRRHAQSSNGDMLIGVFERDESGYYNSAFTLGAADEQRYRKNHLVPFGEFIPLRGLLGPLVNDVLNIPMGDLERGGAHQPPLAIAGQRVAANICYEDVFGEEIIRALPHATLLVNLTNDAWYGRSHAAAQHNQIAQLRALETGRMMLRATNTGVTSIIGADGRVLQQLPQHREGVLVGVAQGYAGATPYVRWGNGAVLLLLAGMLGYAWLRRDAAAAREAS